MKEIMKGAINDIMLPSRAEQIFQRMLSKDEDEKFLEENGAGKKMRLFSSALKAGAIIEKTLQKVPATINLGAFPGGSPDTMFAAAGDTVELLRSKVTPAGSYHVSLRVGTLVIESGVGKRKIAGKEYTTNRGILVSPRFNSNLLAKKKSDTTLLYDPTDRVEVRDTGQVICFGTCCNLYLAKDKNGQYKRRCVELVRRPIEEKSSPACMKIVYGAAFSGYPMSKKGKEEATIEALVKEAQSFHRAPCRSKGSNVQRQELYEAANHVLKALQAAIGDEVIKYLNRLVKIFVDPETKITWNALFNNCQRLADELLRGKDFEYFFPRLPRQPEAEENAKLGVDWPQYLMSFSDRIHGDGVCLQQPNSVLTRYFSRTRSGEDVIDFLESRIHANDKSQKYAALLLMQGPMTDKDSRTAGFNTVWEMPQDTLSILQFHLSRDRSRYTSSSGDTLNDREWIENRLFLLLLWDIFGSFSGGLGSSLLTLVTSLPDMVSKIVLPKARVMGTARVGERVRILRLPGKQIVYLIARKSDDDDMEKFFDAPDDEIDQFSKILRKYIHQIQSKTANAVLPAMAVPITMLFHRLQGKRPQSQRGFKTACRHSRFDILSFAIRQSIRMYEIRRRDGWAHLDFGGLTMVLQLFKKSKTVREGTKRRVHMLMPGSSGEHTSS